MINVITDKIIKKLSLTKSDRHTGMSFINDAKIYETKIFAGLDVTIMDCDFDGCFEDVREKNLVKLLVSSENRCFHTLVSAVMLDRFSIDEIETFIINHIGNNKTYKHDRRN